MPQSAWFLIYYHDNNTALAIFCQGIIYELIVAVDGKTAKQMKGKSGNPIRMLNVFAQTLKLHLFRWAVGIDNLVLSLAQLLYRGERTRREGGENEVTPSQK